MARNRVALLGIALLGIALLAGASGAAWMMSPRSPSIELELPDLHDGHRVSLAQLRGQVVVVVFVAAFAPPTAADGLLESLRTSRAASDATFIVVIETNDTHGAAAYARHLGRPFSVVHDAGYRVTTQFQNQSLPAIYVFDRDGSLYRRYSTHPIDASVVESDLAQLERR